jgi:hypothetical protein
LKVLYNSNLAKEMKKVFYNGTFAGCRKRPTVMFSALVWLLEEMYDGRRNVLLRLCMMKPIMVMMNSHKNLSVLSYNYTMY